MSYNFYIGQDVVAVRDSAYGAFKKDELFTIIGLRSAICTCNHIEVDIGKMVHIPIGCIAKSVCNACNANIVDNSEIHWLSARNFAPLDELTNIDELKEVLEQPIYQVLTK